MIGSDRSVINCKIKQSIQGTEQQQTENKVSDTVRNIEDNSRHPVRKGCPPAADKKVGNCAQRAEAQSEKSRYDTPEQDRAIFFEKESDNSQDTPQIEIAEPPHPEAITESLKQHKGVYDEEYFFSACQGIEDDEQAHHFDIGQDCQKDLSQKQYGGQKAKNCQLADILLCQINSLLSESAQRYPDPV